LPMYSATVMFPFWVVARVRHVLTARALVYDENIASITLQASATTSLLDT
jgi:hypothetical protein